MTPEQQRIAIAEFMGWHSIQPSGRLDGQLVGRHPDVPKSLLIGNKGAEFPDYPNDLEAMREVLCRLNSSQMKEFGFQIQEVSNLHCVGVVSYYERDLLTLGKLVNSPAHILSEAALKALGLWKENQP